MKWVIGHKNDPRIADLLARTELWFMPIQNVDGYDYTFTCGVGAANHLCGPNETPSNRFWRKTLRDNDGDGIYGEPSQNGQGDGVDPNRNYPAKRGIDEEGATNQTGGETYRGPYALSEPENLAFDRLLRKIDFKANVNYHSAGQLLLTPVSYITDYAPVDATIFNAMTGTDGDGAVEPYQPQRSSDLYESNGDTIDNGYMNYGVIGWTPELDTCATGGGPAGCNQFAFPDDEEKVEAVFQKNLPMALNIAHSAGQLDRPRNFDNDPGQYQIKATHDIQPTRFDVSYGATQPIEANVRRSLGPVDVTVAISGPGGANRTVTAIRAEEVPPGERYGDAPGQYYKRVRVTTPANFASPTQTPRPAAPGDTVAVTIRAGGLQQRFSYRVAAVPDAVPEGGTAKQRVLVIAAEDYTRRLAEPRTGLRRRAALPAAARRRADRGGLRGRDVRRRRAAARAGGHADDAQPVVPRRAVALRRRPVVLGRRLHPAGRDRDRRAPPRHADRSGRLAAARELGAQDDARPARVPQRGRQGDRRRPQHPPVADRRHEPVGDRPVRVGAGQAARLLLPAGQRR